ncbi:MAG: transcription-repair coupling factor [Thermodesulfovibrionales bacterium]
MPTLYDLLKENILDLTRRLEESEAKRIYNLSLPHFALFLLFREGPFAVVEDSAETAAALHTDLQFLKGILPDAPESLRKTALFPPPSTPEAPGERARVLHTFMNGEEMSLITSKDACLTGFLSTEIEERVLPLRKGADMERGKLENWLRDNGYKSVSVVMEQGEYSPRGWLFDIYPITMDAPVRVEFFGDVIDLIRQFDIETQRSIKEVQEILLLPSREEERAGNLIDDLRDYRTMDLFVNSEAAQEREFEEKDGEPVLVSHRPFTGEGIDARALPRAGLGILPEERKGIDDIPPALEKTGKRILAILPSDAQAVRLKEILFDGSVVAPLVKKRDVPSYEGNICITIGRLSSGVHLPGLLILTDRDIFGERPTYRPIKKSKVSRLLLSIDDLKPGDYVVHKDHGIGRFAGIQRQRTDGNEEDLVSVDYANGRIYVPFHSIDRLQKYSAGEGHMPSLEKLGSRNWQKTKQKVRERVREMAEKLLTLYAERTVSRGFVFSDDTPLHREFDDFFPYEETPDQLAAVEEIKKHMHSDQPMDMLVCGDVGYGKTEVAIRAAFRAVFDGKQAAVLVPTTLLAEQHYRNFRTRFSGFPVKIDYLSRFRDKEEAKKCITSAARGEVDIVIGTHMLLNKKVQFHDLGLLIIDEEHRFGVAQKERLKELKKGVDVLTLTATPIPRTLQMSLSGIREITTIETPPEERLAVRSSVAVFNDRLIREAIERELGRGGQVFFVHNRIMDIDKTAAFVQKLVPAGRVIAAHGQMNETQMEKVMLSFLHKETDVLVCTAIIGSGIDIPTANTIIVDRADTFGLSDLYQLRGRVGRGNTQAYAYFLIPGEDLITDDAKKRLQAIQEMSYLGAGFRLALKDLEIRGAGNLLGPEQSGYIHGVGFELYMEMLEKAVAELKGEEIREEIDPQIRLHLSAFIPEEYISDITLRLSLYRRISAVKSAEALEDLRDEILDRFGPLPEEVTNLLHIIKVKILSKLLFIVKVYDSDGRYRFLFLSDPENQYRIPEDFFDRLLKVLFGLSSAPDPHGGKLKFLPDGFELDARSIPAGDALLRVEDLLDRLAGEMCGMDKKGGMGVN